MTAFSCLFDVKSLYNSVEISMYILSFTPTVTGFFGNAIYKGNFPISLSKISLNIMGMEWNLYSYTTVFTTYSQK